MEVWILMNFSSFVCLLAVVGMVTGCGSGKGGNESNSNAEKKVRHAIIEMEKGGEIEIEFYDKDAPNTVENFCKLARQGFYDGLTFHRVIPGFMAQGGCPRGDGTGDPGYKIKAEFNSQKHLRGTVAMARSQSPDSAGSQFYICFAPQPSLDNQYTVFGKVVRGMEIVDSLKPIRQDGREPAAGVTGDRMKKVTIVE